MYLLHILCQHLRDLSYADGVAHETVCGPRVDELCADVFLAVGGGNQATPRWL
jgi:hypothetical protein